MTKFNAIGVKIYFVFNRDFYLEETLWTKKHGYYSYKF